MAKFYGAIGYGETVETPEGSGVWKEQITEKNYYGDIVQNMRRISDGVGVNEDVTVSNSISIVADAYAIEHFFAMRYIVWQGVKWDVQSVDVQRPRLILRLGGVWNGPTAPTTP